MAQARQGKRPGAAAPKQSTVRLTGERAASPEAMAAERGLTLSRLVRELLAEAVTQRATMAALDGRAPADRLAADVAEVRAASPVDP